MSNSPLVNYTKLSPNYSSRTAKIDRITIHHMAGNLSVESCGNVFATTSRQASSNYGVGTDGRVGLYVSENHRAWTSSNRENDNRAVTIEVANDGGAPNWHVSDKALAKTIELCADICQRNGIAKLNFTGDKSGNLTMHKWFASTACPGPYLESKFQYIADEVNKRLGASAKEEKPTQEKSPAPEEKPVQELYRVREAWDKPKTQVGAYKVLKNAKAKADKSGLSVFDSAGKLVYPETTGKEQSSTAGTQKIAYADYLDKSAVKGVHFRASAESGLNVRSSGAIKDDNIIRTIPYGHEVIWYGYYTGDFYLVQIDANSSGYVHKGYLTKA